MATESIQDFGPAMAKLPPRRRAFVTALLDQGSKDATAAARRAGYEDNGNGAISVTAHRLTHDEGVLEALREESIKRMRLDAPLLVDDLLEIAHDKKAAPAVRLKAIDMALNRIGMAGVIEHKVTHEDNRTRVELLREFIAIVREGGLDLQALVKPAPPMIDVTPEKADG